MLRSRLGQTRGKIGGIDAGRPLRWRESMCMACVRRFPCAHRSTPPLFHNGTSSLPRMLACPQGHPSSHQSCISHGMQTLLSLLPSSQGKSHDPAQMPAAMALRKCLPRLPLQPCTRALCARLAAAHPSPRMCLRHPVTLHATQGRHASQREPKACEQVEFARIPPLQEQVRPMNESGTTSGLCLR
jgi:hypothetical protein